MLYSTKGNHWQLISRKEDVVCFDTFWKSSFTLILKIQSIIRPPQKMLCCPLPTDRKMRKNRVGFFYLFFLCQIWAKNLLKFVFNGLKKHLHDLYMRFDCIPPEFSPFRNLEKILENSTLSRYEKKKKKKSRPTDPIFKFWSGEGNIIFFFFWPNENTLTIFPQI